MPSLQKTLTLLFLLSAATALAAPKSSKRPIHGWPTADCQVEKGDPRDTYSLRGNNWNVTEAQLKHGINTDGTVLTGWEFKSAINVDDVHTFKAKVSDVLVGLFFFLVRREMPRSSPFLVRGNDRRCR